MIFWIIGYIVIFIIVIALCKAAARADKRIEDIKKDNNLKDLKDINYKE